MIWCLTLLRLRSPIGTLASALLSSRTCGAAQAGRHSLPLPGVAPESSAGVPANRVIPVLGDAPPPGES
jgi:hypothetical protein